MITMIMAMLFVLQPTAEPSTQSAQASQSPQGQSLADVSSKAVLLIAPTGAQEISNHSLYALEKYEDALRPLPAGKPP